MPFHKLKVIELASVLAGPAAGMFFAELGAQVIKIENKRIGGDVTRSWKLPSENKDSTRSAYYNSINWGKQSLFLDLEDIEDKQQLDDLLKDADILITNFKMDSAEKLGLHYDAVKRLNPSIIHANLNAFGEQSSGVGYDVLLQAETGYLHMTGHPGGPPAKMPVALIDILAAHQLKEAILIALLKKQSTGEGSYLSVSLAESAIASLANQASNFLNEGFIPQKMGSQHPNISPYGDILKTSDNKEIIIAIGSDKQFHKLCDLLQMPELAEHPNYSTNSERVKNRQALIPRLQDAAQQFQQEELIARLKTLEIPAGRIRNMQEVFELEIARDMILENDDNSKCVSTIAFRFRSE